MGTGPILLIVQSALSLVILVAIFTMQFFEPQQYKRVGDYYHQVMAGTETENKTLSTLSTPITVKTIKTFFESIDPEEILAVFAPQEDALAQGGEETVFPRNASFAKVVVSAQAKSPLPCDATITSGYGVRSHPITGKWDFHTGIDLAAPEGTEIHAIYPGKVVSRGYSETYGNYIMLEHSDHLYSLYCHCKTVHAAMGQEVKAGSTIAVVGTTGISTGAHLHLSILLDGYYIDPMNLYSL